jgi:hypothetical protein
MDDGLGDEAVLASEAMVGVDADSGISSAVSMVFVGAVRGDSRAEEGSVAFSDDSETGPTPPVVRDAEGEATGAALTPLLCVPLIGAVHLEGGSSFHN